MRSSCDILLLLATMACLAHCVLGSGPAGSASGPYFMSEGDHDPTTHFPESIVCSNLRPQHSLDIMQIMGIWYGSEIIMHTHDAPGVFQYDTCVIIHLTEITEEMQGREAYPYGRSAASSGVSGTYVGSGHQRQPSYVDRELNQAPTRYLTLRWAEKELNLLYQFNYTLSIPGLWLNSAEQRGNFVLQNRYQQFQGSVTVVKAVQDHLVLTFCGTDLQSSIYSIVLTRHSQGLNMEELRSVKNLLLRRGLHTDSIRKVCASGGAATFALSPKLLAFVWLLLAAAGCGCRAAQRKTF